MRELGIILSALQTTVARINWMLVCLVVLLALLLFLSLIDYGYDDPFITYRYAQNLMEGEGFVYNAGLRVQSTTTPLYTLLLAFLGHLWPDLPRLSNLISTLSLEIGALFLYLLAQRLGKPVTGVGAALLYCISPLLISTVGAETIFYTTLSLVAFYWYAEDHLGLAMVFAALAALTRTDGILVAGALGAHHLIARREIPWRQIFLYGLIVFPWYLFARAYFGSPFASTLFTKQQQAQMLISDSFWQGFVKLLNNYSQVPLYRLHAPLIALGVGWVFRARAWNWLPLLLWTGLYFSAYVLLGVSRYFWYYGPLAPAAALLASLGWTMLLRWIARRWRRARALVPAVWVLGLLLLLAPQARSLSYRLQHSDPRQAIYRKTGQWLAENTPPEATVGMLEVGIVGYYARRPVVGFAGLIQPQVAAQMAAESTYLDTSEWAIQTYRPDFVVMPNGWMVELTRSKGFRRQYEEIAQLYEVGYRANPVHIYANKEK